MVRIKSWNIVIFVDKNMNEIEAFILKPLGDARKGCKSDALRVVFGVSRRLLCVPIHTVDISSRRCTTRMQQKLLKNVQWWRWSSLGSIQGLFSNADWIPDHEQAWWHTFQHPNDGFISSLKNTSWTNPWLVPIGSTARSRMISFKVDVPLMTTQMRFFIVSLQIQTVGQFAFPPWDRCKAGKEDEK